MAIPVTSGLVLRFEADSGVATAGGAVVSWADTSGFGNHLTGVGDASFGVVMTPSGLPSIVLDGNGDKLEKVLGLNGLPAGNQDRTVFFVVDYDNPQGVVSGAVFGDNASNQTFGAGGLDRRQPDGAGLRRRQRLRLEHQRGQRRLPGAVGGAPGRYRTPVSQRLADRHRYAHLRHRPRAHRDRRGDRRERLLGHEGRRHAGLRPGPDRGRARAGRDLPAEQVFRRLRRQRRPDRGRRRGGRDARRRRRDRRARERHRRRRAQRRVDHHPRRSRPRHDHRHQPGHRRHHLCARRRRRHGQLHLQADRCERRRVRTRHRHGQRDRPAAVARRLLRRAGDKPGGHGRHGRVELPADLDGLPARQPHAAAVEDRPDPHRRPGVRRQQRADDAAEHQLRQRARAARHHARPELRAERPLLPLLHAGQPAACPHRPLHLPGELRRADLERQPVERGGDLGGHRRLPRLLPLWRRPRLRHRRQALADHLGQVPVDHPGRGRRGRRRPDARPHLVLGQDHPRQQGRLDPRRHRWLGGEPLR